MEDRDSKGRFAKGSTGNPKGRPKKQPEPLMPEDVLDTATMEAVTRLIDLVHSKDEAIALHASIALLDRTLGLPINRDCTMIAVPKGNVGRFSVEYNRK